MSSHLGLGDETADRSPAADELELDGIGVVMRGNRSWSLICVMMGGPVQLLLMQVNDALVMLSVPRQVAFTVLVSFPTDARQMDSRPYIQFI